MSEPEQQTLFEAPEKWEEEYQGMPEFDQEDQTSFKKIIVHFASREDMMAFGKLVGQPIGTRTRAIWYPKAEIGTLADKRYVDVK